MRMNVYQERAAETAIYPDKMAVMYLALGLVGEAGEVASKVKKAIRDEGWEPGMELPAGLGEKLVDELGDVLWYVAVLANALDCDLSTLAEGNVKKLADRKARGVIGGSGDNR